MSYGPLFFGDDRVAFTIPGVSTVRSRFNNLDPYQSAVPTSERDRVALLPDSVDNHSWSGRDMLARFNPKTSELEFHYFCNRIKRDEFNKTLAYFRGQHGIENIKTVSIWVDKAVLDDQFHELLFQGYLRAEASEAQKYPALCFRRVARQWI